MKLSVIIPVYNEKNTIREILNQIRAQDIEKEIIVVDDFSTDGTRDIIMREKNQNTMVIFHSENRGKGRAIRTALQHVTGDIIIIQDADLEYDPRDYFKLLEPIKSGKVKVVYGSRRSASNYKKSYYRFLLGGIFLSWLTNLLYGSSITDEPTCYKVFKADVLKNMNLKCERFEFCPEVTAKVLRMGYDIHEVPISYNPRKIEEGKKIGYWDGLVAIYTLLKYRFFLNSDFYYKD